MEKEQTLGELIREIRGGRSQEEFGTLLGVGQSTVSGYERDEFAPTREVVKKLAAMSPKFLEKFIA